MTALKTVFYLFAWSVLPKGLTKTGSEKDRIYYLSIRPRNNPKNSIDTRKFNSRGGRNSVIRKILNYNPNRYQVLRNTDPKQWLKDRKKK